MLNLDVFNRHALADALTVKRALLTRIEEYRLQLEEAEKNVSKLEKDLSVVKFSKRASTNVTFSIDKDFNVRPEVRINKDMADKLVAEGYIDSADVANEEAQFLAYLLIVWEITDQMLNQYTGKPVPKVKQDTAKTEEEEQSD